MLSRGLCVSILNPIGGSTPSSEIQVVPLQGIEGVIISLKYRLNNGISEFAFGAQLKFMFMDQICSSFSAYMSLKIIVACAYLNYMIPVSHPLPFVVSDIDP